MTELTREQIENFRRRLQSELPEDPMIWCLCDMALRTHDAEQRAQRAEAAIIDALSVIEGAPNTTVYTTEGSPAIGRWVNGSDVGPILRAALATPPPETDKDRDEIENGQHPEPIEYEQTGDALVAMQRLEWPADYEGREADIRTVLQALTASGVPYIPEEVRRLPGRWQSEVDPVEAFMSEVTANQRGTYIKCAVELERALASAPAVCEWTPDDEGVYESACGESWLSPEGIPPEEMHMMKYCHGCGRRIQIAAAPTDGRE